MRAAENGDEKMVEMLLKHGADVNKSDWLNKFTPLMLANKDRGCEWGSWSCEPQDKVIYDRISELLIKNGADVNLEDAYGKTLLHDAAQNGFDKVAELVLENGGTKTVNHKTGSSETPLCYVAYYGRYTEAHNKIADLLIKHGADVNLQCNNEKSPLHLAAIKNRKRIVELLVENGADVTVDVAKSEHSDSYKDTIDYLEQHEKH